MASSQSTAEQSALQPSVSPLAAMGRIREWIATEWRNLRVELGYLFLPGTTHREVATGKKMWLTEFEHRHKSANNYAEKRRIAKRAREIEQRIPVRADMETKNRINSDD